MYLMYKNSKKKHNKNTKIEEYNKYISQYEEQKANLVFLYYGLRFTMNRLICLVTLNHV